MVFFWVTLALCLEGGRLSLFNPSTDRFLFAVFEIFAFGTLKVQTLTLQCTFSNMTDVEDSNFSSRFKGRERPPPLMAPPANVSIQPSGQHSPLSPAAFFLPSVLLPLSSPTPSSPMTPSALLAQQMYAPVSPSHVVSDLWSAATTSPTAVPRSYAEASYSQPPEVLSRQFSQGPKESFSYRQEIQPGYGGLHSDPRYPRQQIAYQSVAAPQHASFFNQQSFQRCVDVLFTFALWYSKLLAMSMYSAFRPPPPPPDHSPYRLKCMTATSKSVPSIHRTPTTARPDTILRASKTTWTTWTNGDIDVSWAK